MKLGAVDYLPKPFTPAQVRLVVQNVAERRRLQHEVTALRHQLRRAYPDVSIDSRNSGMRHTIEMARQVAHGDSTVLLVGESGTGKGLLARSIHEWSTRAGRPFVTVHCPSLSAELFESELFGHAKGAFTSAVKANPGRVSYAERGTLFLDEIGDLPAPMQGKLLRFIQDREYERVGDPNTRRADVRLIAATNHDLQKAVRENRFREDLYYRLNVVAIETPPLRSRPEDIVPLAAQFLAFFAARDNRPVRRFTPAAETALERHGWPGNVRELQNVIERAVIFATGIEVAPGDLVFGGSLTETEAVVASGVEFAAGADVTLEVLEREHILRVVSQSRTLEEAAHTLGIDPSTLWRKRREYRK
jgi:NtrC-family two-component system response regulator AlgB